MSERVDMGAISLAITLPVTLEYGGKGGQVSSAAMCLTGKIPLHPTPYISRLPITKPMLAGNH
jgi:hypothetical protein